MPDFGQRVYGFDDVRAIRATAKAVLCIIDGAQHWMPRSQIDDGSEVWDATPEANGPGKLIVSEWIAKEKGFMPVPEPTRRTGNRTPSITAPAWTPTAESRAARWSLQPRRPRR